MGRQKSYQRSEVLEKAMQLFWKKGYVGTHLSELMQKTGLNKFSLYNEFGGKEALFHQCLSLYLDQADEYYSQTLNKTPYGLKNITNYFSTIRFSEDYHGCFFVHTLSESHVTPEKSYDLVRSYSEKVESFYLKNIDAALANSEIKTEFTAKGLAQYLTMVDLGLSVFGIHHKKGEVLAEVVALVLSKLERSDERMPLDHV